MATLYNLRVNEAQGKLLLTRHRPRRIIRAEQLRDELLRILPAPMIRMMTAGAESQGIQPGAGMPDGAKEPDDHAFAVTDDFKFTNQTHFYIESLASTRLTELLSASLAEAKVRQGYANLSDAPSIYDGLIANCVLGNALPLIDTMLQGPPTYISNLGAGKLTIRLEDVAGNRTASVTVEAPDNLRPGRSSTMGMRAYSMPEFPRGM